MPAPISRQPSLDAERFICPRCNSFASQTWHYLSYKTSSAWGNGDAWAAAYDINSGGPQVENVEDADTAPMWSMSECASCTHRCVWRGDVLIYPQSSPAPVPSEDMPPEVRELYDEASAVASVSKRAGAAFARATLERLLKLLDPDAPKGSRLDEYIARVIPRVTVATGKLLTLIRHVGNKSLHVDDAPDEAVVLLLSHEDVDLLPIIFQTINDVVEELITKPNQAALLYDAIPATVRAAAEAKAEKADL